MQLSICTYNCNGLAKVRQHAPDVTHAGILDQLGSDIVCIQETKMSHADLWPLAFKRIADVPGWDSYFCFTRKGSYSGVATYCRTAVTTVRAAEEGLLRVLPPQNPVCAAVQHAMAVRGATAAPNVCPQALIDDAPTQQHARAAAGAAGGVQHSAAASSSQHTSMEDLPVLADLPVQAVPWPSEIVFPATELHAMFTAEEALAVDKDGRCIITDHGLFVLFNCYFPACTGNNGLQQIKVKRNMWRAVDVRMRALLAAGRHVVLAGDFNVVLPWWGQDNVLRGSGLEKRAASTNRLTASQDATHSRQQLMQQQPQSQDLPGQGSLHVQDGMDTADASGVAVAALALRKQEKQEAAESQQAQELPVALQPPAKEDNFAPHAQFRRGKPVLPSSGTGEWLIQLITPPDDTQDTSAQQVDVQPTAGVLVDTTKALNPGVELFKYPDAKKPGSFKERPPNTNWSQFHGIRNDQHGARGDYIFVADAANYAVLAQKLKLQQARLKDLPPVHQQRQPPSTHPPLQEPHQQQQQQRPSAQSSHIQQLGVQEAFSISMLSAQSSAFILRELRWTDHAPVVLQLQLPAQAVPLLRSPAADAALQAANSSTQQRHHIQPEQLRNRSVHQAPSADPMQPNSTGMSRKACLLSAGSASSTAAAAGAEAGLPCPVSSYWLTQPEAAVATAAAVLAAAGVPRVPADVLTCSVIEQLRRSQYAAATEVIGARARQLYDVGDAGAQTARAFAGAAAVVDESGVQFGVIAATEGGSKRVSSQPAAEQPHGASQQLEWLCSEPAAAKLIPPAQPPAATAAADSGRAAGDNTSGATCQQQPASQQGAHPAAGKQDKPSWWAGQRHAKQGRAASGRKQRLKPVTPVTAAVGSKRKGRGWQVVSIGNGCTATVACSSSDDSDR